MNTTTATVNITQGPVREIVVKVVAYSLKKSREMRKAERKVARL